MPQLVESYDATIELTATKSCKYALIDGATARDAISGKYCRRLVETGDPTNPGGGAFILPYDSKFTKELTNATLELQENGSLESLDDFFERWGTCPIQKTTTLSMGKLRYFFAAAYGSSVLVFIIMILDPQAPLKKDGDQRAQSDCSEKSTPESPTSPRPIPWLIQPSFAILVL